MAGKPWNASFVVRVLYHFEGSACEEHQHWDSDALRSGLSLTDAVLLHTYVSHTPSLWNSVLLILGTPPPPRWCKSEVPVMQSLLPVRRRNGPNVARCRWAPSNGGHHPGHAHGPAGHQHPSAFPKCSGWTHCSFFFPSEIAVGGGEVDASCPIHPSAGTPGVVGPFVHPGGGGFTIAGSGVGVSVELPRRRCPLPSKGAQSTGPLKPLGRPRS